MSRQKNLDRLLGAHLSTVLLVGGIVVCGVLVYCRMQAPKSALALRNSASSLQAAHGRLASIKSPASIELGQKDLTVPYILTQLRENDKVKTPGFPSVARICVTSPTKCNQYRSARLQAEDALTAYDELVTYRLKTLQILQPLFEYNPQADLGNIHLNESDIQLRVNTTREGLTTIKEKLAAISPPHHVHDTQQKALMSIVNGLITDLNRFDANKDKDAWYKATQKAQEAARANREDFWEQNTTTTYTALDNATYALTKLADKF